MPFKLSRTPTEADLREIEATTGLALTESYKRNYLAYSGLNAEDFGPEIEMTFPCGTTSTENLQRFLTVDEIKMQWPCVAYLEDFVVHYELEADFVEPRFLVPIADVYDGAVYVAVGGRHIDKVFLADNGDFGIACLADNLDEFLKRFDLTA